MRRLPHLPNIFNGTVLDEPKTATPRLPTSKPSLNRLATATCDTFRDDFGLKFTKISAKMRQTQTEATLFGCRQKLSLFQKVATF